MPDMYAKDHYDLAGFVVGAVESDRVIDGSRIGHGDQILALASSGVHSNGYSLVRRILAQSGHALSQPLRDLVPATDDPRSLGAALLAPTRIYVRSLLAAFTRYSIHGLAHITGGGITDNLPRVLPAGTTAVIDLAAWQLPPLFQWLRAAGPVTESEMLRTFNCGVGMLLVVAPSDAESLAAFLRAHGETVYHIGCIAADMPGERVIYEHALG